MRRQSKKTKHPGIHRIAEDRFRVRLKLMDPRTGRQRELDRVIHARTAREAATAREELRASLEAGSEQKARVRLGEYATSWIAGKLPTLKRSTASTYADVLDLYVVPAIGDHFIDALTRYDIIAWRDRQDCKPATVNGRLRVLKTLLADAAAELGLPDPAARVSAVRHKRSEGDPNCLTAHELARVLSAAETLASQWYPHIATLAMTGMRFGEATALRWGDIDETAEVIHVRRAQWRGTVDSTKTGSARTVPLPAPLAAVLAAHRRKLLQSQAPGLADGWVFPSRAGTLLRPGASLNKPLKQVLAEAGIERRFTIHGFRRTFNNLLRQLATGEVVRSMTGHVTEAMTEHYSHVGHEEKRAAVARIFPQIEAVSGARDRQLADESGDRGGDQRSKA